MISMLIAIIYNVLTIKWFRCGKQVYCRLMSVLFLCRNKIAGFHSWVIKKGVVFNVSNTRGLWRNAHRLLYTEFASYVSQINEMPHCMRKIASKFNNAEQIVYSFYVGSMYLWENKIEYNLFIKLFYPIYISLIFLYIT